MRPSRNQLAMPPGVQPVYLNEFLFDWQDGRQAFVRLQAKAVPKNILSVTQRVNGHDISLTLMAVDFNEEALAKLQAGAKDAQIPLIETDSMIIVPRQWMDEAFELIEKWESVESLETHLIAPHMVEYRPKVKDLVKHVGLQILQPA